ncbi:hypothetical protein [Nesterenkonia muleiensis]|uniref:hypothetical protein n=1 Tax=Nesterenkonia muleiensis TaxID=2282648 RepID=UPI000E7249EB|nr:hypothetical protein [Nesterenkonia muleiensis]
MLLGDTHYRDEALAPFQSEALFGLLLDAAAKLFGTGDVDVVERWQGIYATAPDQFLLETASDGVVVVTVTTGIGACDVLLELSGKSSALHDGLGALDVLGTAVIAGSGAPDGRIAVDPEQIARRDLQIQGSHNDEPRHLVEALDFLAGTLDLYPWQELVAPARPLEDLRELLLGVPGPALRYAVTP